MIVAPFFLVPITFAWIYVHELITSGESYNEFIEPGLDGASFYVLQPRPLLQ